MNCNNILSVDELKHDKNWKNQTKLLYEILEFMELNFYRSYLYKEIQVCTRKLKLKSNGNSQSLLPMAESVYEIYKRVR